EVQLKSQWPEGFIAPAFWSEFQGLKNEMKLNEAGRLLDEALRKAPRNLTLLIYQADVLSLANRWQDVERILGSILLQTDLSSGTRAVVLAGQIKAVLRQENQE